MLIDNIRADRMTAMKERDKFKMSVLTTLVSEAAKIGFDDGKRTTTDTEVIAVCKKFIKGIDETLLVANKQDCIDDLNKERTIVESYMPTQMSEADIQEKIATFLLRIEDDAATVGMVMKHMKENFGGQFDGKIASKVAKDLVG